MQTEIMGIHYAVIEGKNNFTGLCEWINLCAESNHTYLFELKQ